MPSTLYKKKKHGMPVEMPAGIHKEGAQHHHRRHTVTLLKVQGQIVGLAPNGCHRVRTVRARSDRWMWKWMEVGEHSADPQRHCAVNATDM